MDKYHIHSALNDLFANDQEVIQSFLVIYYEQTSEIISELEAESSPPDISAYRKMLHKLKPSLYYLQLTDTINLYDKFRVTLNNPNQENVNEQKDS